MPSTLPGFLLLAGLLMFLFALLAGSIKIRDASIAPNMGIRSIIGTLGVVFMLGSVYLYFGPEREPRVYETMISEPEPAESLLK